MIREGSRDVKVIMENLLEEGTLHTRIDEQIVFNQLDCNEEAIWSLLLASGYFAILPWICSGADGRFIGQI